jgi:hypothetical protein
MCRSSQNAAERPGIVPEDDTMRMIAIITLVAALGAMPAVAQVRGGAPVSFGADVGLFAPFESGSSSSFTARATADLYWWSPTGMRFALGFTNPEIGDGPFKDRFNTVYLSAGLIRSVRGARLHPYGHAGVGIYHLSGDRSGTQLGLAFGGGVELAVGWRNVLLTPELTAHLVSGDSPRFSLALTVGLHTKPE